MTPWFESFVFGVANSLHCACMCGPLAFAFQSGPAGVVSYHCGRATSYGALGVVLGATGALFGADALRAPSAWVAYVLAAGLVVLALLGDRGAVAIPGLGGWLQRVLARSRSLPPALRALGLGIATPLLPCGLLWSACAAATLAGSGWHGGTVMLGFALGSLPLLLLAQTQARALLRRFGPRTLAWAFKVAMLGAAALLIWRGIVAQSGSACCH